MSESRLSRQLMAEGAGTFLLVLIGCGSIATSVWTGSYALWPVSVMFGLGAALGIYASAKISGGHINPAVTIALACIGAFPWRKVAPYVLAQTLGAFVAALVLYYFFSGLASAWEASEGITRGAPGSQASAMVFSTYAPNPVIVGTDAAAFDQVGMVKWFVAEVVTTGVLVFAVLFLTEDENEFAAARGLVPLLIGAVVTVLVAFEAPISMASMNPARDLGPRAVLAMFGWGEIAFPGPRGGFWIASVAPIIGAVTVAFAYTRYYAPAFEKPAADTAPRNG